MSGRISGAFTSLSTRLKHQKQLFRVANLALYFGAGLSFFDLACDIAMVREYALASQPEFASATLGTIACSLFFQVVIVTSVYHKAGFLILFREIFYVLTFTKPGVDVHRVASNAKQLPLATITPKIELVALRGVELFAEVIPSTVIQAMAFAKGHNTNVAILSLLSSILTAAFISASISIEKDIDSENRSWSDGFYGLYPLNTSISKTVFISFLTLFMAGFQLTSKAFACALCNVESGSVLAAYFGVDVGLALLYKVARRDFTYWMPAGKTESFIISTLSRVAMKVVMDFTGLLQARHPYEYGGAYYTFTIITSPFVCFYFGFRYISYVSDPSVADTLDYVFTKDQVYGCIAGLTALQFLTYGIFLRSIEHKYRRSFLDFTAGREWTVDIFKTSESDEIKLFYSFGANVQHWKCIEDEVRRFLNSNILRWIEEDEEWFNEQVRVSIFEDFIEEEGAKKKLRTSIKLLRERREQKEEEGEQET